MSNAEPLAKPMGSSTPAAHEFSPLAGLLSYLVPGLGQIAQGRTGKGFLFLVCIYTLFFYGMYLGTGTVRAAGVDYHLSGNVYLPDTAVGNNPLGLPRVAANLYNRPQYAGQFWVGVAAWPALFQYASDENQLRGEIDKRRKSASDMDFDRPEEAGRLRTEVERLEQQRKHGHWLFGQFERTPSEEALNAVNTGGNKLLELGWVYTVIAGVLNIMVIYDAIAGPAFPGLAAAPPTGKGD